MLIADYFFCLANIYEAGYWAIKECAPGRVRWVMHIVAEPYILCKSAIGFFSTLENNSTVGYYDPSSNQYQLFVLPS